MHGLGSVIFWIAVIGHFAGIAGILAGIVLRFRKNSPVAATATEKPLSASPLRR